MDAPPHTTMHQLMALAEDKPGWMEFVRQIHSPKSRESSYTRQTTNATDRLDLEAEEWHIGAQNLQFNECMMSDSKQQKAKRVSNDQKSRPNLYTSPWD